MMYKVLYAGQTYIYIPFQATHTYNLNKNGLQLHFHVDVRNQHAKKQIRFSPRS